MKKTIFTNLIIIISFFLIFEIILRAFNLSSLRGISESYLLDKKNTEGKVFGEKFFTDNTGMRIPFKNFKYNPENKNIVLVGDSFVFGPGIKEENTFAGKLRIFKSNINIFNSSKPGNNLNDYFDDIKFFYEKYNSNKFYIFVNFDDIRIYNKDLNKKKINNKKRTFENFHNVKFIGKVNNFLRSKFHTYIFLIGLTTDPVKRYYYLSEKMFKSQFVIKKFNSDILKINKFLNDNNLDGTFFITPYNYQLRKKCTQTEQVPQKEISKIFKIYNINFHDFTSSFCNKNKNLFINFDPTHLSKHGHHIIFDYLKNL